MNHPSIVAVYDSGEWDGVPFLVMECLPGRTLADELGGGPLPAARVREMAVDIASALDAAHRAGVIHRDVKPGNILFTGDGRVKLADFGIAKSTDTMDHTQTGLIVGTPAYLAPERLDGRSATPQSDLYSLGVVLYEALIGERPFRGDTPVALAHAIHATSPIPLRDRAPRLDRRLTMAVDAAMAKEPSDRPSSAAALVAMLDGDAPTLRSDRAHRTASTTAVLPSASDTAAWREPGASGWWLRRTPGERRGLVAAAVLLTALVLVVLYTGGGDDPDPTPTTVAPATAPTTSLPLPLDEAITRLEEAVRR